MSNVDLNRTGVVRPTSGEVDGSSSHLGNAQNDGHFPSRYQEQNHDRTRTNSLDVDSTTKAHFRSEKSHSRSAPPPPFRASFWSSDPITAGKRKMYFRAVGGGTFLMIIVIFAVLSIFWASLYNVSAYIHKLEGWIVDFDGGPIGQTVIQAFRNNTGMPEQMSWRVVDASLFPGYLSDIEEAVVQEKVWVVVSVNRGASANLTTAIANVDGSYNGSSAVTTFVNEARNEDGYSEFIQPLVIQALMEAADEFSLQNSQQLAANTSADFQALLSRAPTVVTQPMYFTINNLRPFDAPVATAVGYVGLIYLLIISFIICMMNYQARVLVSGLNRHLTLESLVVMRICIPFVLYFFVSAFFSMLSLAFQAPFDRVFGHSGFVIYWIMNWMGMLALGLAMESVITVLTPIFTPFFLILWIISNVSVASVPIEVLPGVFKYGYASPFYNVSKTVRTILFNTKNEIGLNFGVQFAWIGISLVTMTLFTILMRKKEERAWKVQQEAAVKEKGKV
ncbi:uncharacterized protein FOMMEDRAFT_108265 [Fomitiporia mediterranea MF3/22]|uniref:uncharacterized protein n=1 Tax=Fomitiporia mediterranea (strain MF3/22) TaxID=694068 RepID=UPI0004409116|nr:uncharacterized protein FOMMEDRAFT_108265 [Fomitiporia mediterranea MF3/22]EJD03137.1 hypothetical protein FOMMEDRAFT_108265 [Fomitiporia mediterranea MF3/22]